MNLLQFNYELCNKCGYCVVDCPARNIIKDENDFPMEKVDGYCLRCGHCEAICPEGGILVDSPELLGPVYSTKNIHLEGDQMMNYMQMRRSIRNFKTDPVDSKIINQLMDTVRFAPTAGNGQPVKWMVIHDKNEMIKLTDLLINRMKELVRDQTQLNSKYNFQMIIDAWAKGVNVIFRTAPHLAFTYTEQKGNMALIDSTIALTHFDLALPAFGLGGTWAGFFYVVSQSFPELPKLLGLPEGHTITGGIMFGYSQFDYYRVPKRNKQILSII